jgi:hypothetical protein
MRDFRNDKRLNTLTTVQNTPATGIFKKSAAEQPLQGAGGTTALVSFHCGTKFTASHPPPLPPAKLGRTPVRASYIDFILNP